MFDSSAILIIMLLAYSIVEFVYREKLNLWLRTGLMVLILVVELFWRFANLYQYILIPIAAISYCAISFLQSKAQLQEKGREFRNLLITYLTHIIAFCVIYIPFRINWYPVSGGKIYYANLDIQQWEVILLILVANIWLAPRIIRAILNDLTYRTCQIKGGGEAEEHISDEGAYQAGTLIGILERLLIIATALLTTSGTVNISLIGFILGTKSLARFKKFDNQEFVEYFIVGTMASVLFALLTIWPVSNLFF